MGNRTTVLLFLLAAGLGASLAVLPGLGLVDRGPIPARSGAPVDIENPPVADAVSGPLVELSDLTETVDRPLFAADRRPVQEVVQEAPVVEQPAAVEAPTPPPLELSAVIIDGARRLALFRLATGAASSQRAEEGGQVEGWTVSAVRPDGVTLERNGARLELALRTFKPPPAPPRAKAPVRPTQEQAQAPGRGAGTAASPQPRPRRPLRGPRRRSIQRRGEQ